ncbi:maltose alpha-D-glucosyltransferase [Leeuwenhoekiella parthenopeia]|uniref:maltose alpha-D-glucosyltransferase n=1 Tax=Leeuwenhoekiella parthenopeia TaxID=2890320 RepID=A0ABS8GSL9_9FLAO|nr:maltose alpha-D-glucosyltransferase [Leeuwenhoekiella parthenopeia]MCC4212990.1 maltose alpha-D-glucosyltransferase [Leeuwenhoekiella parthenopeia]
MTHPILPHDQKNWYKDAVIYELHIKAFFDSNGDGIGDFEGLLQKLDYLEELGITAIWLLPFYPSPLRDDGYDIADYYSINPSYGEIEDFKRLVEEAHNRGLKVITELVINHTSDQHEWFQRARKAPAGSKYRNYYVWSDSVEKYKDARIIFTDTEPSNWSWDPVAGEYYWHRFFAHQPDLNFDNPDVQEEVFNIMDFWCDLGVDGFRLDAVPYLFERDGTNCENLPETHDFLKKLRKRIDDKYDNKLLLAEANMWPEDSAAYFGEGDECHMNYHFPIMPRMFMAVKMEDRYPIIDIIDQTPDIPESCQWAIFLRNHDELTLEMVTDEERDYMYKVYSQDPKAKINVGIRRRLAPLLDNNRSKIELMNVLLFSLPGTPVMYYGDEIGMGDNFYLGDRDGVRTPMQWTADRNAGFSMANPQKLYLPTIIDPQYNSQTVNVESQQINPSSLLWWMKRILNMRKSFKAFGRGDIKFFSPSNSKILAFTRSYGDENILVIANLSRFSQAVELELDEFKDYIPMEVFSHNKFPRISSRPYLFTLAPHGYYWFSLTKADVQIQDGPLPEIKANSWEQLFETKVLQALETKVFPRYFKGKYWFTDRNRIIQGISVANRIDLDVDEIPVKNLIVDVTYNEGLPEIYQFPLAFVASSHEKILEEIPEKGRVAQLKLGKEEGFLVDAVHVPAYREFLFYSLQQGKTLKSGKEAMIFDKGKTAPDSDIKEVASRLIESRRSNTSIIYDHRYFLKLYRRLDSTINPDAEISKFLTETVQFDNTPLYMGSIRYKTPRNSDPVLGMMQDLVTNTGTAWENAKDAAHRYMERVETTAVEDEPEFKIESRLEKLTFEELNERDQELVDSLLPERISLLGQRSAEMHQALASNKNQKGFEHEEFSLHYQRSLYSSLQSLTRETFENLKKSIPSLPEGIQQEAEAVLKRKSEISACFKRVFDHKLDTLKIRTHGDYHLEQLLWTGKDYIIINFEGEPTRPFSERRILRSGLRDVASMIRSLHYAAYTPFMQINYADEYRESELEKWAELWFYYMTRFFLKGYCDTLENSNLIPSNTRDFTVLLETFMLEKAIMELNYELNNRPHWSLVPLRGIQAVLDACK